MWRMIALSMKQLPPRIYENHFFSYSHLLFPRNFAFANSYLSQLHVIERGKSLQKGSLKLKDVHVSSLFFSTQISRSNLVLS
jgi:hypothetical protein